MAIKRKTNGIPPIPRGPRNPGGPYADAKKKDPKLDSYIKTRNNSEKGTAAYNAAQNKINSAYGKGPQRTVAPKKAVKKTVKKTAAKPTSTRVENLKKRGVKAAAKSVYKMKKAATSKNPAKRTTRVLKQGMKKQAKIVKKIVKTKARVAKRAAKPARPTRAENLQKRGIKAAAKTVYKIEKAATSKNPAKRTTRAFNQGMEKQAKIKKKFFKTNARVAKRAATKGVKDEARKTMRNLKKY